MADRKEKSRHYEPGKRVISSARHEWWEPRDPKAQKIVDERAMSQKEGSLPEGSGEGLGNWCNEKGTGPHRVGGDHL